MGKNDKGSPKKPALAIVTRTKNRPTLLRRALESIANQSSLDYIHVLLNDGGDREEFERVLQEVPDSRRVVLHNKSSVGLTPALNQAINACESTYVSILDDDDSWHPERIKTVLEYLRENPETKACVVKMDIVVEDIVDGRIVRTDQYLHPDSGDGEVSLYKQCARNYISNGIVTYTRAVYDELGGYDETLLTAEDWDFGVRLLLKYDVDLIPSTESLFYYHQRPDLKDENGNSVHAAVHGQEVAINKIRNKYLRHDIQAGVLGVGYIMNQIVADVANVVRIEGHVNYVKDQLAAHVDQAAGDVLEDIVSRGVLHRIREKIPFRSNSHK